MGCVVDVLLSCGVSAALGKQVTAFVALICTGGSSTELSTLAVSR